MSSTSNRDSGPYSKVDRLADEFVERYRRGERPSVQEYVERHPDLADEIRDLFPALARLEQAEEVLHHFDPEDDPPRPALRKLGDFRIVREIGRGGMGVVYEAEQVSLGRRVALKVLPHDAGRNRTATERFRREARAAARLHHTNIVPVFEVGQEGEVIFYAMQFIRGQGLDAVIDQLRMLRKPSRTDEPGTVPSSPAPVSPIVGPLESSPGASAGRIARSLLTGQFAPLSTENSPARRPTESAAEAGPTALFGAGHVEKPATATSPSEDHLPAESSREPAAAPSGDSSAVLPGGTQLSSIDAGDRGYFRSVAHIGRQAAQALGYAHSRGILHRDIKPSNLLLDTDGVVWITDFGLAKAEEDGLTRTGDLLGTLRYMAPERFRGEGDARADVYALGLTLYELLTLRPAFDSGDRLKLIERIQQEEPPRPRSLDGRIPRDLETIALKASDKDPRRRYVTADELAEDLRRFLEGEPIRARRIGEVEKAWKWARRRPALSSSLALLAASLVAGTAVSTSFAIRARDSAERAGDRARAAMAAETLARGAQRRAQDAERAASLQSAGLLLDRGLSLAEQGEIGPGLLWMLQALKVLPGDAEGLRRAIRTNLAAWGRRLPRVRWMIASEPAPSTIAPSPDGRRIAVGYKDGTVRVHDAETGRPVSAFLGVGDPSALGNPPMFYTRDGRYLIAPLGGGLQRYDAETIEPVGEPLRSRLGPDHRPVLASLARDDRTLVVLCQRRRIHCYDLKNGSVVAEPEGDYEYLHAVHLRDGRLYTSRPGADNSLVVEILDAEGRRRLAGPWSHSRPDGTAFGDVSWPSFDGRTYWCLLAGRELQEFGVDDGRPVGPPIRHPDISRMSNYVQTRNLSGGREFQLIDNGNAATILPGRSNQLDDSHDGTAFGPDADRRDRWSAEVIGSLLIRKDDGDDWSRFVDQDPFQTRALGNYSLSEYSNDGETAFQQLSPSCDGASAFVSVEAGSSRPLGPALRLNTSRYSLRSPTAFSRDGRLAAAANGLTVRILDGRTGRPIGPPLRHINTVSCLAFSPDGATLAAGDYSQSVVFWDVATGRPARPPLIQPDMVWSVSFRPDGRALAVGTTDDRSKRAVFKLWNLADATPIGPETALRRRVTARFSPDGDIVMTTYRAGVRFFSGRTGEPIGSPTEFLGERIEGPTWTFTPDGRKALVGTDAGRAYLFDATSGTAIPGKVFGQAGGVAVTRMAVAPDGRLALLGYRDGTARLWDVATARPIGPPTRLGRGILSVAFAPDGRTAMASSGGGQSHRWPVPAPVDDDLETLALRMERDTGHRLEPGPTVVALNAAEWAERRERLRGLGEDPDAPFAARADDVEWHALHAHADQQAGANAAAIWHLERLARLRPDDWTSAARIGALYAEAERFDRAAEAYDRAERIAGPDGLGDWHRLRIAESLALRRPVAAAWYIDRVLSSAPDDAQVLAWRAAARSARGDARGAEDDRVRAAALADDPELLVALGDHLARAGRWPEASAAFARAASAGPLAYPDRTRAAVAMLKAGEVASFRSLVDGILAELDPPPTSPAVIYLNLQSAVLGPTTPEQAARLADFLELALAVLRKRPNAPADLRHAVFQAAGAALHRAGRHREALARLREGIAAEGGKAWASDDAFLALASLASGDRDEAAQCLERLERAGLPGEFLADQELAVLRDMVGVAVRPGPSPPAGPSSRD